MAGPLPGEPSLHGMKRYRVYNHLQNDLQEPFCSSPGWYLSRKEIEDHSPSRRDGIDLKKETQLQKLYCSFLQDLGIKLKVPQVTIATSMIFCHRFFLRQSHAKNEWQTIATVCIFLAAKVEETPRLLRDVVIVAYELVYRRDPAAVQRIRRKEVYEQQKELVIIGERLLLSTLGFDLNVQHPYKPLVAALKKFKIAQNELAKVAWNFVNDWLRTTLCLQFKPHYIAAGSICLAAKFHKVKLPSERGMVWWQEFDVTPRQLEEVIQQMLELLEQNRRAGSPTKCEKATQAPNVVEKAASNSPQSCVLRDSVLTCNSSPEITREMAREREPSANSMYQNSLGSRDPACSDTWASRKVYTECKTSDWRSCVMRGSVLTCNSCHGTTMEVGGETLVNLMYQKSLDIRNPAYNDIQVAETRDSQGQTSNWHSCVLNGSVLTCSSSQQTNWGVGGETSDYSMYQSSLGNQNPAYDDIRVAGNGESQGQTGDWNSCVLNGSVLTCNSSYEANRDVARVTSMNLINQSSVGNRLLAYNDIQVAKKGELPCQAGDWHSFVQSRAVLTCSSSNETNREVGGEMENLIDQISLGKQDLACNDSSVAGKGEAQCQISDCGSTMMGTVGLEDCGRSDKGEPDQIMAIKYRGERGETGISGNYVCGGLSEIDMVRIRATLKRRRMEITASKKADVVDDGDDAWIERELENGIVSR